MKKVLFYLAVVGLILSLLLAACAKAPAPAPTPAPAPAPKPAPVEPIKLRFSYATPPQAWTTQRLHMVWAKQVEEATKGKVKIEHYPAETLHKSAESLNAITGGVTDVTWLVYGYIPGKFPLSEMVGLPFIDLPSAKLDGKTVGSSEINSLIFQELYETVPEVKKEYSEIKVLFLFKPSTQILFTSKKPVRNLNDLKGLKLRPQGSLAVETWKALGASPASVGSGDLYSGLERGVIDGLEWAWAGVDSYKLYEVLKYYTDFPVTSFPTAFAMNLDKWNSLPKDVQDAIMSVSGRTGARLPGTPGGAWEPQEAEKLMQKFKQGGFGLEKVTLDSGQEEKWVEIGKTVWDKLIANLEAKGLPGKKVLDELLRIREKYRTT